jgi:quercetin dioxygenase-like cupin family protein
MSYKVTMKNESVQYEAPGHYDCKTTRLHNPADVNDGTIVMGLSHFLPGGGANMAPAKFEMVYYIQKGEMTVSLDDGKDYVLHAGDSLHFGPGTGRACKNTGVDCAEMITVMIKPQA